MFVRSYSATYCIYVPGKPGICFHNYCAVYDECKYSDTFWLADRIRLFVQYTNSLSSLCKFIWSHWTFKMLVRYILSSVWVRLSIFSPLSIIQYVGLYVFSLLIYIVMIVRINILCLIIITKSEVWTITHCLGLGHETMVSAVCLSIYSYRYIIYDEFRLSNIIKTNGLNVYHIVCHNVELVWEINSVFLLKARSDCKCILNLEHCHVDIESSDLTYTYAIWIFLCSLLNSWCEPEYDQGHLLDTANNA